MQFLKGKCKMQQGVPDSIANSFELIDFIAMVIFISSVYLVMSLSKINFLAVQLDNSRC